MGDDIQLLVNLIANGLLPAVMVLVGLWFGIMRVWPYFTIRDAEQRERNYEIDLAEAHGLANMADAISQFAAVVERFCIQMKT